MRRHPPANGHELQSMGRHQRRIVLPHGVAEPIANTPAFEITDYADGECLMAYGQPRVILRYAETLARDPRAERRITPSSITDDRAVCTR